MLIKSNFPLQSNTYSGNLYIEYKFEVKTMKKENNTYNLIEFQVIYGTEVACENALFNLKWNDGFVCPKCGHTHYYKISSRRLSLYQCKECGYQASVTKDTIMENSKLSLVKWFLALYFVAQNKDGISEVALANYIGITLKSAWLMLHKIRSAMGLRDQLYQLGGNVEMDEAFFGGKKTGGKRGRGADKAKVAVALQVNEGIYPTFLKMQVIPDCTGNTLLDFAQSNIESGTMIHCDAFQSYNKLADEYTIFRENYSESDDAEFLKWLHVMISNIKAVIAGTFHGLKEKYLQRYLDEFCYRFNRRNSTKPIFDHLLECCIWGDYNKASELSI